MNAEQFKDIFYVLHNIDKSDLEAAGVITIGANGGSDWNRFNSDVGTFVLKLRQENVEALFELVRGRMPSEFPGAGCNVSEAKAEGQGDRRDRTTGSNPVTGAPIATAIA